MPALQLKSPVSVIIDVMQEFPAFWSRDWGQGTGRNNSDCKDDIKKALCYTDNLWLDDSQKSKIKVVK